MEIKKLAYKLDAKFDLLFGGFGTNNSPPQHIQTDITSMKTDVTSLKTDVEIIKNSVLQDCEKINTLSKNVEEIKTLLKKEE